MLLVVVHFIFCLHYGLSEIVTTPLNEWTVINNNGSIRLKITVPGGIYTDLSDNGILFEDVLYRFNDIKYRWVGYDTWTYYCNFTVEKKFLSFPHKELIFHGIDTISTILLNGGFIGTTDNMFVKYSFDVQNLLKENNTLEVTIYSPILKAMELAINSSHVIPPQCVPLSYNGECHVHFLRKMQASFAWDWGPAVPSVGIWKPVELIGYNEDVYILDITVSIMSFPDTWVLSTVTYFNGSANSCENIIILYLEDDQFHISPKVVTITAVNNIESTVQNTLTVPKNKVQMWWPNGFGEQRLYNLTSSIKINNFQRNKTVKIGFRTVQLVQEPVIGSNPRNGLTFYFKINEIQIFAKGSNWIPSDILPEKSCNEETIRNLLEAAKLSNMNMIRVWGGGLYESDLFYQYADEYGIMIWQDMMFACNMYPADDNFLMSVAIEVKQQVLRLQHHACIVIWAGNNENEAALRGDWYGTEKDFNLYQEEYVKLYVDTIKPAILQIDNTRPVIISSPTNGLESEREGFIAKHPYSPLFGDIHYYNYYVDGWDTQFYKWTRFCSEYGFQSLPSYRSLETVSVPSDLEKLETQFMDHRQHLLLGNLYMMVQVIYHFELTPVYDIKYFIYLTQINQAWAVKSQTEWYRRCRNVILPDGNGLTMGALYWQLNDVWQAPSWSSIEHNGKWKMLQYYTKKMFAPVLVSPQMFENGIITVTLISDLMYDIENANLVINIFQWTSMIPVMSRNSSATLKKESARVVLDISLQQLYEVAPSCTDLFLSTSKCFFEFQLFDVSGESLSPENYIFPSKLRNLTNFPDATVTVTVMKTSNASKQHDIIVETNGFALFVWLDTTLNGYFSDNGFIQTIPKKNIVFISRQLITYDKLQSDIIVTKLKI